MKVKKLSIISFNIQGKPSFSTSTHYRLGKIGEMLNSEDVDIINLQEVFTYKNLNILKERLQNFCYYSFEKFIIGPRGGLVIFSKIPLEKQKYISYSFSFFSQPRFIGQFLRNKLTDKGILINKIKNSSIFIVNTHLTASLNKNWTKIKTGKFSPPQKNQIAELSNSVNSINGYSFLVLTGDFNIPKSTNLYKKLVTELNVKDVFKNYNSPTFHKEFLPKGERGNRLDYLLIKTNRGNLRVTNKQNLFTKQLIPKNINRGFVSDHMGLKANLEFN